MKIFFAVTVKWSPCVSVGGEKTRQIVTGRRGKLGCLMDERGQISNPSLWTNYPIPFSSLPSYLFFAWPQTHAFCMEGTRETPCLSQWKKILRKLGRGGLRQEPRRVELPGALPLVKSPVRVHSESGQSLAKPSTVPHASSLQHFPPLTLFPSSFAPVSESVQSFRRCV